MGGVTGPGLPLDPLIYKRVIALADKPGAGGTKSGTADMPELDALASSNTLEPESQEAQALDHLRKRETYDALNTIHPSAQGPGGPDGLSAQDVDAYNAAFTKMLLEAPQRFIERVQRAGEDPAEAEKLMDEMGDALGTVWDNLWNG